MKAMEHPDLDLRVGFVSGVICGVWKLLDVYLLTDVYMIVLIKVFFTAVIGGAGGVLGKYLITYCMKKWKERFNKNKKQ